ncbi:MAG: SUMF1/EgtB/PvdO family nonheme iron enzyme [Akkermansia sp.]|nr:SUMF1/EgtB/PvdO family nonheme iron enzyme [Akkermansia sp.]
MEHKLPESVEGVSSRALRLRPGKPRRPEGTVPAIPDLEMQRIIGRGAYGEVWLARAVTGAYRAVKVVWREDFDDERTFAREFEGVLNYEPIARGNPGLVHILHVGRRDGEHPCYYYVMELADDAYTGIHIEPAGYIPRTLQSDIQLYGHRPLPLDFVLEVGSQLAHALVGLHAEELAHRDIKPANVVFVNSRAKLADAGLVAHNSRRSFVGTEGYIPPDGPGTPRADVYALAKVLYEMATGLDRLDFPELPPELPEGATHRRWLKFNQIICAAAEPVVGRNSIVTAAELAERLDRLRGYGPARPPRRLKLRSVHLLVAVLAVALLAAVATHFLPADIEARLHGAAAALAGELPPTLGTAAGEEPAGSSLFIASVPSGASIYTEDGVYVDETPYGPVEAQPGQVLRFVLRKEGYADTLCSGEVPENGLLSLGGDLTPYRPPLPGQVWKDAQGTAYEPDGQNHRATTAVTRAMMEEFVQSSTEGAEVVYEEVPGSDLVRTSAEGISAFTLWLSSKCTAGGTLGHDHTLIARPEPTAGTAEGALCAYRLCTVPVRKTPITIYSNPAGAEVRLNGRLLGVTPMQSVRVPLAPYLLEVRLPGHTVVRRSGLSPRGLSLNVNLTPNHSVTFGTEWINSLGQKFRPLAPALLAGATEVRVSDYRAYCRATGVPEPQRPTFVQNEHHPVVYVSRTDAENFARWLTQHERNLGVIEATDFYRLPTDEEWSAMAGKKGEEGGTPYARHRRDSGRAVREFPWGMHWPPPEGCGNFADVTARPYVPVNHVIPHYNDGFAYTAPVGSFTPNALGLHDLSGNVQEWVSGEYGGPPNFNYRHYGVTRGGDYAAFRPNQLNPAGRTPRPAEARRPTVGFRLLLERYTH